MKLSRKLSHLFDVLSFAYANVSGGFKGTRATGSRIFVERFRKLSVFFAMARKNFVRFLTHLVYLVCRVVGVAMHTSGVGARAGYGRSNRRVVDLDLVRQTSKSAGRLQNVMGELDNVMLLLLDLRFATLNDIYVRF